jgi:lysophospholipase L1-like esterase
LDRFEVIGRELVCLASDGIPHLNPGDLISAGQILPATQPHADGIHNILYTGGTGFLVGKQVLVDYETEQTWAGSTPRDESARLPRLHRKLRGREPLTLAILGDSISEGADATARLKIPPHAPPYPARFANFLRATFGSEVTWHNFSAGGKTAAWGEEQTEAVAGIQPDLLIIAFGMNDSSARCEASAYRNHIERIISGVTARSPATEFIVVSGMTPIPYWAHSHLEFLAAYHVELSQLARPGVALADVRTSWLQLLERKDYLSLSGNGINHPNDFGHRLYADVLIASALGLSSDTPHSVSPFSKTV